ncbi:DUF2971 domain-containing protein [Sphingomonas sp. BIUV-7]|uniref:DUF2971 domain-containing protein n=1 Tax=Sphingomonas natans TaxID=3063330 RepID=A0ABT8Y446_9SPHN|nr:DUF2971 domain-containing protein [Sphingomonas sp. BIUV-7]MDO6413081.1 DUF2971 domain-containing protein [Sphingomonas sp. BIUV-7]
MAEQDAIKQFADFAFPYANDRFAEVAAKGLKMAHYTTAEAAALILGNQSLWLRNAALMNDFSEVAYGNACLEQSFSSGLGARLQAAIDVVHPGLFRNVTERINNVDVHTRTHTYLTSLSAHNQESQLGRLSMWRAYGGPTSGVAIIFNTEVFAHDSDRLGAYSSPVLYGGVTEFSRELVRVIENIENNRHVLAQVPFDNAASILFNSLQFSTLSTKHPAFEEEQEWRVIHHPLSEPSAFISTCTRTIRGIPQMICEVPLRDQVGLNMPWLDLNRLLSHVIIGPCVYPKQVAWAFREILREIGIANPDSRIAIANIPLRQNG